MLKLYRWKVPFKRGVWNIRFYLTTSYENRALEDRENEWELRSDLCLNLKGQSADFLGSSLMKLNATRERGPILFQICFQSHRPHVRTHVCLEVEVETNFWVSVGRFNYPPHKLVSLVDNLGGGWNHNFVLCLSLLWSFGFGAFLGGLKFQPPTRNFFGGWLLIRTHNQQSWKPPPRPPPTLPFDPQCTMASVSVGYKSSQKSSTTSALLSILQPFRIH